MYLFTLIHAAILDNYSGNFKTSTELWIIFLFIVMPERNS